METAVLGKRVLAYIINAIIYLAVGFALAIPFLTLLNLAPIFYVLISLGLAIVVSFFLGYLLLALSKGYTIGSAIMGIKYVSQNGNKISKRQAVIRSAYESIFVFVILDYFYFLRFKTERGVIDRLSDSFAIDTRI